MGFCCIPVGSITFFANAMVDIEGFGVGIRGILDGIAEVITEGIASPAETGHDVGVGKVCTVKNVGSSDSDTLIEWVDHNFKLGSHFLMCNTADAASRGWSAVIFLLSFLVGEDSKRFLVGLGYFFPSCGPR